MDKVCPPICAIELAKRLRGIAKDLDNDSQTKHIKAVPALKQIADALEQDAIRYEVERG